MSHFLKPATFLTTASSPAVPRFRPFHARPRPSTPRPWTTTTDSGSPLVHRWFPDLGLPGAALSAPGIGATYHLLKSWTMRYGAPGGELPASEGNQRGPCDRGTNTPGHGANTPDRGSGTPDRGCRGRARGRTPGVGTFSRFRSAVRAHAHAPWTARVPVAGLPCPSPAPRIHAGHGHRVRPGRPRRESAGGAPALLHQGGHFRAHEG